VTRKQINATRKQIYSTRFQRAIAQAAIALSMASAMPAARAGGLEDFISYLGYVKDGYDALDKYVISGDPNEIAKIQAIVNQAKTQIIAELDGLAAAWDSSCAANALDTFQNIDKLAPDNLQAFAISSDKCVTDAQAQIGAVTDKAAIDKIGFALNTVGPVALLANARAGFATNLLKQHIIDANAQLRTKLNPTCGVTIDNPDNLPSWGEGPITGHGACYNYTVPTPARISVGERGGIFYLQPGPGRAFLPWPMRGDAVPDDDLIPWRGYTVGFPVVDFSIAVSEVMQGTSWQVAGTVLDQLLPSIAPVGTPLAMTTNTNEIYKPVNLYRTDAGDNLLRGLLNPYPDQSQPTFAGWHPMDGAMKSVAAGANADGRAEIFAISRVGNIFHRWQQVAGDNGTWLPWAQMDGQLSTITVARNQDGTLQVFGTNPEGQIWTRNQILGGDHFASVRPPHPMPAIDSWTPWKQIDGWLSQAVAVTDAAGLIHLFGVNGDGMLFHRQQVVPNATDPGADGGWTAWEQIDTPTPLRQIAVAIDLGQRLNIIGLTYGDQVFHRAKLGGGSVYTGWLQIPGSVHQITATKEGGGSGELVLLAADAAGNLYRNTSYGLIDWTPNGWITEPWNGWQPLPASLGGNPAIASPGNLSTVLNASASVGVSVAGGTYPYTLLVSGLPAGLSVQGTSIVGTPSAPGAYTVSAVAVDATGEQSGWISFGWNITTLTVPNVVGMPVGRASGILRGVGLGLPIQHNVVDANCDQLPGTVLGQSPAPGAQVGAGYAVQLGVETRPGGRRVCN
jgi:hypothetical protein